MRQPGLRLGLLPVFRTNGFETCATGCPKRGPVAALEIRLRPARYCLRGR